MLRKRTGVETLHPSLECCGCVVLIDTLEHRSCLSIPPVHRPLREVFDRPNTPGQTESVGSTRTLFFSGQRLWLPHSPRKQGRNSCLCIHPKTADRHVLVSRRPRAGPRGLGASQRFCSVSSASVFSRIGTISTTTKTTIDAIRVRSSGWMTCIAAGTCFFDRRPQPAKQYVHETSPACPSYLKPLVASGPFAPPHPPDVPMTG